MRNCCFVNSQLFAWLKLEAAARVIGANDSLRICPQLSGYRVALQSFNLEEMHHNTAEITDNWSLFGTLSFWGKIDDH